MKAIIVTNNADVKYKYEDEHTIEFVDGLLLDVLVVVRDKIHEGHKLLTHPLSGSIKPNETPYKSIIITYAKGELDHDSAILISSSIETVQKFINIKSPKKWSEDILEDFREIDLTLIESGIKSMRQL